MRIRVWAVYPGKALMFVEIVSSGSKVPLNWEAVLIIATMKDKITIISNPSCQVQLLLPRVLLAGVRGRVIIVGR
jgi:hypothetical protein